MQTVTLEVQDNYIQSFMNYVNEHSASIQITKDKNLELDPYFYERQKELHQIRDDIKSGKSELISFEDFENNVDAFEKELEKQYAN
ncbi:MAG: hypothetical protein K8R39_01210 [Arcobacteraceae bacterium]|nr:hypothetical protein [Arcobacteraceae bacterium]